MAQDLQLIVIIVLALNLLFFFWVYVHVRKRSLFTQEVVVADSFSCYNITYTRTNITQVEVTTSQISGRRFVAGVLTTRDKLSTKLPPFKKAWASSWPDLHAKVSLGFRAHSHIGEIGDLVALYYFSLHALYAAEDFDYLLILNDSELPHPGSKWPEDLDKALNYLDINEGDGLLLGGEGIELFQEEDGTNSEPAKVITKVKAASKVYAAVIPEFLVEELVCACDEVLKNIQSREAPAKSNVDIFQYFKRTAFVTVPFLVGEKHI